MEGNWETIQQRVEWLDQERRKTQSTLLTLQERLTALEGGLGAVREELKEVGDTLARLQAMLSKVDRLEERLAEVVREETQARERLEQELQSRLRQQETALQDRDEALSARLAALRKWLDGLQLEAGLQRLNEGQEGLREALSGLEERLRQIEDTHAERVHQYRLLQEAQERESRRVTDLQGEVSALRKRLEEGTGRVQLVAERVDRLEAQVGDLAAGEAERRREVREFLDRQAREQVERERLWKQWEARFAELDTLVTQMQQHLTAWQDMEIQLTRAQQRFEEMTERMDRRIHEITEMQRLAEDRFRQEWNAFKADDQKRWANYLLSQEEKGRDVDRRLEQLREGLAALRDQVQELHDFLHLSDEQTQKRLQALADLAQTWLQEYERVLSALR